MHSQPKCVLKTASLVMIVVATCVCGCQTWPNANFPLQNATRVPPPGTGTYQLPTGYYNNNTSALPTSGQVMQANATSGLRTPSGGLPTTNLSSTNNLTNNPVTTADFAAPGFAAANNQSAGTSAPNFKSASSQNLSGSTVSPVPSGASPNAASASLSDSPDSVPSLQWHQY